MPFHKIGVLFKNRPTLLIALVSLVSLHISLLFYFWHDDFSVFYGPQIGECSFKWPYSSYCSVYGILIKVFGYQPFPYFLLGLLASIGAAILFYKLLLEIFPRKVALLASCLFACSYFGIGTFFESYVSLFSFTSLGLLFSALLFTLRRRFIISLLLFGAAVGFFQARSGTYLIPFLSVLWLYAKIPLKKKIWLSVLSATVFYITFFPGSSFGTNSGSFFGELGNLKYLNKIIYFLQSISSFVLTDSLFPKLSLDKKLATGIVIASLFGGSIIYDLYYKKNIRSKLLGVALFVSLYIPFGLRSDWYLDSLHRYTLFVAPAIFIIWSSFHSIKYWTGITVVILITQIYFANSLLGAQLIDSNIRKSFYSQLRASLPSIPTGSYLYFYFPQVSRTKYSDIFRVGYLPSESSVATEYRQNFKNFTLATESEQIDRYLQRGGTVENLFVFYFGNGKLINNTNKARSFITKREKISYRSDVRFTTSFQQEGLSWVAKNSGTNFEIENNLPFIPFTLTASIVSTIPLIPIPFSQNCVNCVQDNNLFAQIVEYETKVKDAEKVFKITTSATGENTDPGAMFDSDRNTYWMANRQLWHEQRDVFMSVVTPQPVLLDGVVLSSISDPRVPTKMQILANGQEIKFTQTLAPNRIKVSFDDTQNVSELRINILDTAAGDSPVISEVYLVPRSLLGLDITSVESIKMAPAINIQSPVDRDAAVAFMKASGEGCIKVETLDEKVSIPIDLISDGKIHSYQIKVPSMGRGPLKVSLGCIQFPIDARIPQLEMSL